MIAPMDTDSSSALLVKAADFAARKHIDQKRKGKGQPYIVHPIGVARILSAEADIQEPLVLAAAMLHDTIEDTDATEAELRAEFGDEITDVVLEVSDDKSLPKAARKRAQIDHAPHMSREATLVKMADKLYNLRDPLSFAVTLRMPLASMSKVDLDLGTPRGAGRDAVELELAERAVVLGKLALALQHVDLHRRLVVGGGGEGLLLARRDGGVALDELGHDAAEGLDAERERGDVEQQHVLDVARPARRPGSPRRARRPRPG
jgi:hypothetical protein